MEWDKIFEEERGRMWTDYVSSCRRWKCAQGHGSNTDPPWSLFRIVNGKDKWVAYYATLAEAKKAAEESAEQV
jgi:hypothetical protein